MQDQEDQKPEDKPEVGSEAEPKEEAATPEEISVADALEDILLDADGEPVAEIDPVAVLEEELAETKDRLLRMAAEMENLRKRSERERSEAQAFAITKFARDVLTVADHMAMAIAVVPQEARDAADQATKNLIEGVELTERELLQVFERHGVKPVAAEGVKFDPNFHEAMFQVPSADHAPGTVVQVVTNGFKIGERLLRPAKVGVSVKAPDAPADASGNDEETSA